MRRPCVSAWRSDPSERWNRTPRLPFGSWSTSPYGPCRLPLTTPRRPCWRSTKSIGSCGTSARASSVPGCCAMPQGKVRLAYPTPKWGDFVMLAVSEIRLFGADSLQIPRRLRAMLEHLIEVLPATRGPALRRELTLLQKAVERDYVDGEDRETAETCDRQGMGGSFPRCASRPDSIS